MKCPLSLSSIIYKTLLITALCNSSPLSSSFPWQLPTFTCPFGSRRTCCPSEREIEEMGAYMGKPGGCELLLTISPGNISPNKLTTLAGPDAISDSWTGRHTCYVPLLRSEPDSLNVPSCCQKVGSQYSSEAGREWAVRMGDSG